MKLFDHSNISGKTEEDVREKLQASLRKELEFKKLQDDLKNNRFNRVISIIALIISIISIILTTFIVVYRR